MKKKKSDWEIGTDELGQAVLRWKVGRESVLEDEQDPLARTYNFLKRLDVAELRLEDESTLVEHYDPYNTSAHSVRGSGRRQS